jgi:nucleoside-diphosphate-sugar epimerase
MSSESALGFTFAKHRHSPEYIPIDELHPMRPQDAYSLSKATAEILCARYSVRTGIRTICLRSPWIWVPEQKEIELYRQLVIDFQKWYKNLWAYVHVYDLASAVLLALENTDIKGHDIFFITANENWTGLESRFLLKKYYPNIKRILKNFSGTASLISYEKAKRVLGFNPKFDVKYLLGN